MTATTELLSMDQVSDELDAQLAAMKAAVYPEPPDNDREWAARDWGVFVWADDTLVSYTGLLFRDGTVDGDPVVIGGIGGVATHPSHRGHGYAPLGMARGLDFMLSRQADFALLVCRDELVPYYTKLGWQQFEGQTLDTQFGEPEVFTFNRVMVGDLAGKSPVSGAIDLQGPAW